MPSHFVYVKPDFGLQEIGRLAMEFHKAEKLWSAKNVDYEKAKATEKTTRRLHDAVREWYEKALADLSQTTRGQEVTGSTGTSIAGQKRKTSTPSLTEKDSLKKLKQAQESGMENLEATFNE